MSTYLFVMQEIAGANEKSKQKKKETTARAGGA